MERKHEKESDKNLPYSWQLKKTPTHYFIFSTSTTTIRLLLPINVAVSISAINYLERLVSEMTDDCVKWNVKLYTLTPCYSPGAGHLTANPCGKHGLVWSSFSIHTAWILGTRDGGGFLAMCSTSMASSWHRARASSDSVGLHSHSIIVMEIDSDYKPASLCRSQARK